MSLMIRRGSMPVYSIPSSNVPYERRKTIINKNLINNINANLNTINTINALNTLNTINSINKINNSTLELNSIFNDIKLESKRSSNSIESYQSIKLLTLYIRKNRNNIDDTIKKISDYLESNNDLNDRIVIYIIELVLNLITENSQIINFLNRILPNLIKILHENKDLTSIENINNELGKLIKLGGAYTRRLIEISLEKLLMKFVENKNLKYENTKFANIQFLCIIIQNAPLIAFGKLIQPNTFGNIFLKILDNFKDPKIEIRITIGELIGNFILMLGNRDKNLKDNYIAVLYKYIYNQFEQHLKDNNDTPINTNLFSGFIIILQKIHISAPNFFKNDSIYISLVDNLMKSKSSKSTSLKIEYIKFLPQLYQLNKEKFKEKYLKTIFEYFNGLLNIKTNPDTRNALLLSLGTFSLLLKKNDNFDIIIDSLLNLIRNLLIDKKIFDKEIFKCLSDLFSNKDNLYSEKIIQKIDFNFLLSKLFKTKISSYKIEFLNSLMKAFDYNSIKHLSTVITSLNVISLILCDEDFNLTFFYNEKSIETRDSEEIEKILTSTKKYIKKYFSQKNENFESGNDLNSSIKSSNKNSIIDVKKDLGIYLKCKCLNEPKLIKCALSLFSRIENEYFFKDMIIFYKDKILPFLFFIKNSKVIQKILDIMLCKFIKIYDSDKNLSEYIIKNILDTLKNFIFTYNDNYVILYAFNILHQKKLFLDLLLENKQIFFNKVFGMLYSSNIHDEIKEKIVQTIGLLASRSNDKNYFIIVIRKNINSLLFSIQNNEDIIQKENNILLLLYYSMYVKFLFDFNLIEKIMEINIDLLLGNEYQGVIAMNILKIFCELLNTDIVNEQFIKINNDKFNEYFQLLLIICILDIKDGGINTKKTETSLKTLYQIIKVKKIDIYKSFSPQFSQKMKKNLTNSSIFKEKSENSSNNVDQLLINERGEKINLVEILLQNVIKGATDECLIIIMNIFGLCGVMEPSKMEKYFSEQGLSIYHLEGNLREEDLIDDNEFKIISYKKNKNTNNKNLNEIDLSSIDPSTSKAVLSLMRILKENSQQEVSSQIVASLSSIIKTLTINEANLIDIILPTILEVIPQFEITYQKSMFDNINSIINIFKNKIKFYLDDIIQLIINFIMNENYLNIICEMLQKLFTYYVYEMEVYYPILIPIFLNLMKQNENYTKILINLFVLISSNQNIVSYLNIMLDELSLVYLECSEEIVINKLLKFFSKIVDLENTSMFYSVIISVLLGKFNIIAKQSSSEINKLSKDKKVEYFFRTCSKAKTNLNILNETMNIFAKINASHRSDFIEYLPKIINVFKETNFLYYGEIKTTLKSFLNNLDYKFIPDVDTFINIKLSQVCSINCIRGFYPFGKKNKIANNKSSKNNAYKSNNNENLNNNNNEISRTNTTINLYSGHNKYLMNQSSKNRKTQIDNDLIIKMFDNSNCIVEEDWHDWFKSSSKILFEQSPSYILFSCHLLSDYYFPLILELYNYGFFTVYINNNDKNKMILTKDLISALDNPKTPNDILLTILNLIEFIERRNVNLCYVDYNQFGRVAYKCRAFAKALYYKENDFLLKNDFDQFEDLLELYYEVKQQESAKGLLELVNKNLEKKEIYHQKKIKENKENNNLRNSINLSLKEKNKYNWYIKIHDFNKALELIDQQLLHEENKEKYETLKKNRIICLNGLCDWEKLFSEGNNINDDYIDEINTNTININSNININNNTNNENAQKILEEEIILSKACMNLNEWSQLKIHFYKIHSLFKNDNNNELLFEQNMINENYNENDNYNIGKKSDINDDEKSESDINIFLKRHGQGRNTDSLDNEMIDNISFNKHFIMNNNDTRKKSNFFGKSSVIMSKDTNYKTDPMSLVNQNYNIISNESIVNNNHINYLNMNNINDISNEQIEFISYDKIISNNPIFNFIDNPPETIFDLNLYSSIINIRDEKYENALRFIFSSKKIILSDIKSLLAESYTRGYELLIKNQLLCLLEQIIEYKQLHDNDENYLNQMVNYWDQGLNMVGKDDPSIYEKFLSLRALVLPIEKEFEKYMDLAKIYRKMGMYDRSEKILMRVQKKLSLNSTDYLNSDYKNVLMSDENKIRINLSLNQCLFENRKYDEALDKSEYLVELLNDAESKNKLLKNNQNNNDNVIILDEDNFLLDEYGDLSKLSNKLKSKIYGNFAIYKQSKFDFEKNNYKYILKNSDIKFLKRKEKLNLNEAGRKTVLMHSPNFGNKFSSKNLSTILMIPEDEEEENNEESLNIINRNFLLATKYNNKSFKFWHAYALFNYKFYISLIKCKNSIELEVDFNNIKYDFNNCEITFAINAVNGFKNSLYIGGKNKNKTFQDLLRLIDIFFTSGSKNNELLSLISICFNEIEVDSFLNVIPQLLCRFNINESNVLSVLILLLIKIGKAHPRAIIFHLVVMKYSNSRKRISAAVQILNAIIKKNEMNKKLVEESEMFIKELNNCAILWHEQWSEAIEETSKMYYNKDYINAAKYLIKLHKKMHKKPENNYEIHFYQKFGPDIFLAENYLKEYIEYNYMESLNAAWESYLRLYRNIVDSFKKFEKMSLDYISTKLNNLEDSNINLPGSYLPFSSDSDNMKGDKDENLIRIKKMGKILKIFNTKQHPRQLSMIGTDNKEYLFLLKGHEDLHQDERAMQLFNLVNTILSNNKQTANKNLFIDTYSVFPLSYSTGIIGWVPNCDTLHQLIKEKREISNTIPNIEHRKMFKLCSKYESCNFLYKVEIFKDSLKDLPGLELNNIIWIKSKNCETWLTRRNNYSRSLAVMSMVGYILGLGDRHPSNLMMSRKTGKIIHIDFGDCFEIAMKRDKFPEKVPFRLTRMLVKALEVSGVEGTFRIICEKVMKLMRDNKDSLLAILGSFLYDPLISFRLMIPMIIKQKKFQNKNQKPKKKESNIFNYRNSNKKLSKFTNNLSSSVKDKKNSLLKLDDFLNDNKEKNNNKDNKIIINDNHDNNDYNINSPKKHRKEEKDEKIEEIDEEKEKNEKKRMENDERHIFNIYQENDEIESEELNKIAKIVLERISNKLSGTEFYPEIVYNVKEQVDKLINEAMSYENLAQSYLGWCPFW